MIPNTYNADFNGGSRGGDSGGARSVDPRIGYPDQRYRQSDRDADVGGGGVVMSLIKGTGYDDDDEVGTTIVWGDDCYGGDGKYRAVFVRIYGRRDAAAHRWELPVLHYHKIMVIYPHPFVVVITQLFSWIIFINDYICILTVPT